MIRISAVVALAIAALASSAHRADPGAAADVVTVDVVESTADGALRRVAGTRLVAPGAVDGTAVVDVATGRPRQRLHGVGAALTESSAHLLAGLPAATRREVLEELFAPERGALSVLRVVIGASDFSLEHRSLADSTEPDPGLTTFSIERDRLWVIPVLREILAIAPDIEIVASPWSAPGWMKDSNSYIYGRLRTEHESAFADYLVRFVDAYHDEGIGIDWLTLQNEPAAVQLDYPSMVMAPDQQIRLLGEMGPRLAASGLATRVLVWDHNWCDAQPPGGCAGPAPASFPLEVLGAAGTRHPVAGAGFHCYGGDQAVANEAIHERWPALQIWHTECSGGTWQADPFDDTARLVLTDRNHWSNATLLWNLALDPDGGPHLGGCGTCRGVVTVDPVIDGWRPEVDLDVLATVARFGPQGSGALETRSSAADVLATGVCSPAGRPAAVVLNSGPARTVTVRFDALALPIEVAARSLTAVRAPEGTTCDLADWPSLPSPPDTPPTTTTTEPTTPVVPAAIPAAPLPRTAHFAG